MKGFFKFGSPLIEISVDGRKIEMLLDTGFNGHIMLPKETIDEISLDKIGITDYITASGELKLTEVYKGTVKFLEEKIEIPILATDSDFALAGMELFHDCKIVIERSKDVVEVTK